MKRFSLQRKQYWVFLIVFTFCALLGFAGLLAGELYLPDNPGGNQGRLAMYRSLGLWSLAWSGIAVWAATNLFSFQKSKQK